MTSRCCVSALPEHTLEQIERRGIQPLDIIEEQDERVVGAREDTNERRSANWNRAFDGVRRDIANGGCSPTMNFSSGMRSTTGMRSGLVPHGYRPANW
jgi:hypothetical protein